MGRGDATQAFSISRLVQSPKLEDVLPRLAQLQGQFLNFVLEHAELVPAGFKRRRAAEPIAGVFDFVWVHVHALFILFLYTVV